MTSRQRFAIFLTTSALVGGLCLPALAGELTPARTGTETSAQPAPMQAAAPAQSAAPKQAAQPEVARASKAAKMTPHHRIARAAPPAPYVQREIQVASSELPTPRYSHYPMMFGVAY
jgi:hypothetical protein